MTGLVDHGRHRQRGVLGDEFVGDVLVEQRRQVQARRLHDLLDTQA
ncbi:MAG: hypothetical protein ACRDZ2_05975 [Ilumatobacteraceae bacterium]